ncbi:MAG: glycosyltransferase family 2 protein [Anaerolineae bacterium]
MSSDTTIDLSIIIVNWNVAALLDDCLRSIYTSAGAQPEAEGVWRLGSYAFETFVVDNASSDDSVALVRARFSQVRLIANTENRGFTGGNNQALRLARGRYALLLNPDTRVLEDALARMVAHADAHPAVGVVGPRLLYGDGSPQSSRRRFPTLGMALFESTLLEQWWPNNRWARAYHMADTPDDRTQQVGWVTGACMLVRAEAYRQVGLLDEGFFMYSEELDWCRRLADAGWRIVYLPEAMVVHLEGKSSDQVIAARHIRFQSSKVRYWRKHHGALQAEALRLFLLATYVLQLLEEGCKYLLGHKRALRGPRLVAYWAVLRSGLRAPGARGGGAHA